jgi:hypothetical protein
MAVTIASAGVADADQIKFSTAGQTKLVVKKVTFDSSYPTGGEPLTASDLGLSTVLAAWPGPSAGYVFEYDITNAKLKAYRQKDPAAAGGADIALPEVGNTTDLSAVSCYMLVLGR